MRHLLRVMIIGLIYGALDELHQSFIAGRTASLGDFLMDGVGLILGLGAFWLCHGSLHLFQKETPP
jgi:VanZ family protein